MENQHMSPIRQIMLIIHVKCPEFVMRQLIKHSVGIESCSTHATMLHAFNEISQRYVPMDEFHVPMVWRLQSTDNKQGSSDDVLSDERQRECDRVYKETLQTVMTNYNILVTDYGISKEQARIMLPLSIYTESIWTMSLQAVLNFIELRTHPHAQYEIRVYAHALEEIVKDSFPNVYKYWQKKL